MVDNYSPHMPEDHLETCHICYCVVSEFYMHEHEEMHAEQAKKDLLIVRTENLRKIMEEIYLEGLQMAPKESRELIPGFPYLRAPVNKERNNE
jgi:hypothetical protein